jgi:hypothetical protein
MTKQEILKRQVEIELLIKQLHAKKSVLKIMLRYEVEGTILRSLNLPVGASLTANKYSELPTRYSVVMADDEGRDKEVLEIILQEDWSFKDSEDGKVYISKIYPSFYCTRSETDFEFRRMIVIGEVGKMFLTEGSNILESINEAYKRIYPEIENLLEGIYALEKELKTLKDLLASHAKAEMLDKLFTVGINFTVSDRGHYPIIEFIRDCKFYGVVSIKATKIGNVFCKLEVTTENGVVEEISKIKIETVLKALDRNSTRVAQLEEQVVS